ncbi:hypothetical protein chiPu_0020131, partial [Chiloscyllium punctatum]|nr:hypothetical protein [Chiloscyllium punctatum]
DTSEVTAEGQGDSVPDLTFNHVQNLGHVRSVLWNLATKHLKPGDWKKLAEHWDFSKKHIQAVETQWTGSNSYKEHGYRMLLIWFHGIITLGKNPIKELYESLVKIEKAKVAEKVRRQANTEKDSSQKCEVIIVEVGLREPFVDNPFTGGQMRCDDGKNWKLAYSQNQMECDYGKILKIAYFQEWMEHDCGDTLKCVYSQNQTEHDYEKILKISCSQTWMEHDYGKTLKISYSQTRMEHDNGKVLKLAYSWMQMAECVFEKVVKISYIEGQNVCDCGKVKILYLQ